MSAGISLVKEMAEGYYKHDEFLIGVDPYGDTQLPIEDTKILYGFVKMSHG